MPEILQLGYAGWGDHGWFSHGAISTQIDSVNKGIDFINAFILQWTTLFVDIIENSSVPFPESYYNQNVNFNVKLHSLSHKSDLSHIISVAGLYFISDSKL